MTPKGGRQVGRKLRGAPTGNDEATPNSRPQKRKRDAVPEESSVVPASKKTHVGASRPSRPARPARRSSRLKAQQHLQQPQRKKDPQIPPTLPHPAERSTPSAALTRRNLALFDKMARKQRGGGRASSRSAEEESRLTSSTKTKTKTTSTTSAGFALQAYKNGILPPTDSTAPANLEDMRAMLSQTRETASPTESAYLDYVDTVNNVENEASMVVEVSGKMLKDYPRTKYKRVFNQSFSNYPTKGGFDKNLSPPQPDFTEGIQMGDFMPFPVDECIDGAVLYADNPRSLTLPHIAGEWKGPGKDLKVAELQSSYDGAALVYARNQALSYMDKPTPEADAAHVATFTTDGTTLNLYGHYATQSQLDKHGTEYYHQYPISSTNLVSSYDMFKAGRKQLRNLQDHARAESHALRDQLVDHWKGERERFQTAAEACAEQNRLPIAVDARVAEAPLDDGEGEEGPPIAIDAPPHEPTPPRAKHHLPEASASPASGRHGRHSEKRKGSPEESWRRKSRGRKTK